MRQADLVSDAGYEVARFPYMCGAFRLAPGTVANMKIEASYYSSYWKSMSSVNYDIRLNDGAKRERWTEVAAFENVTDDDQWHYSCIDMQVRLELIT